jgi:hypothetical protein
MKHNEYRHVQPLRELEWLARYFSENCREDLAQEIVEHLNVLGSHPEDSTVIELKRDAEEAA